MPIFEDKNNKKVKSCQISFLTKYREEVNKSISAIHSPFKNKSLEKKIEEPLPKLPKARPSIKLDPTTNTNQIKTSILNKLTNFNLEKAFVTDGKKERKISILSRISVPNGIKPRVKTYEVKEDTEWFNRNKIIPLTNKLLVNDLDLQISLISDELNIILDNLKIYRSTYLENGTVKF